VLARLGISGIFTTLTGIKGRRGNGVAGLKAGGIGIPIEAMNGIGASVAIGTKSMTGGDSEVTAWSVITMAAIAGTGAICRRMAKAW
jgi:hypothetical protein